MDENTFKGRASRLEAIADVLKKLPEGVHQRAFALLEPYVTGVQPPPVADADEKGAEADTDHSNDSKVEFFSDFDDEKPADNLKRIAAWFYKEYGDDPFSLEDLRKVAKEVGVTIPARPNDTLRASRYDGKKTFEATGRGKFKPTIAGQKYLKQTFNVEKGTKSRSQE